MAYGKTYQGKFQPKNWRKYKGNPTNIFFRSSWEFAFMRFLDSNPGVVEWNSEEIVIPYKAHDGPHRYFVDFWFKNSIGEQYLIEIKPSSKVSPPKEPKRRTKRYLERLKEHHINTKKWEAAEKYCKERGMIFKIITEKELNIVPPKRKKKYRKRYAG